MTEKEQQILQQLKQSLLHLDEALNLSTQMLKEDSNNKHDLSTIWEEFLNTFLGRVKDKGKESNINLMKLLPFPKLPRFF
ncbi:hypothetical protein [Metabacillus sp. RGM 3146]|uniref:hypothetical protein n=1 Tax=Metabacillus sp. RGM 3146 TaxID=3401092 RepID=UPI003B9D6C01